MQYETINDAAQNISLPVDRREVYKFPLLPAMELVEIWYAAKPHFLADGVFTPGESHKLLGIVDKPESQVADGWLNILFYAFQGELWSPNAEASKLIRTKGLLHTSMSVGDVVGLRTAWIHERFTRRYWQCASTGWKFLRMEKA